MTQKAKVGGTPGRAPFGYRNVSKDVEGRIVKLVEVDAERAEHVRWVFNMYATGEWTMKNLTDELNRRGVTALPHGDRPESPMSYARVAAMLNNRYYIGIVTFRGVEYDGRHEPLISRDLFQQAQDVLATRQGSGEKQRVHAHYLKSTVFCMGCGARLCITVTRGKYPYFFCVGRSKGQGCRQPYLNIGAVEARIEDHYRTVSLDPALAEQAQRRLAEELADQQRTSQVEVQRQQRRLTRLAEERRKLLQAHYADAVPLDLLKEEQDRIGKAVHEAERLLAQAQLAFVDVEHTASQALTLAADLYDAYRRGDHRVKRLLNQFFFSKVLVGPDDVVVEFTEPARVVYEYAGGWTSSDSTRQGAPYLRHRAPSLTARDRASSNVMCLVPSA